MLPRLMAPAILFCGATLVACGERPPLSTEAKAPDPPPAEAAPLAQPATATREDVVAALRCHAVLSSAMANRIVVEGDGAAAAGIREQTRWFAEAQRRSRAAGLSEVEFDILMAETRAPMTTQAQRAENTPVMNDCLARAPGL